MIKQTLLDAVTEALQTVSAAIDEGAPTPELQAGYNQAFLVLQNLQNALILASEQALLDTLKANQERITELNKQIEIMSKQLDSVSETVKKVSDTVGIVVGVLSVALAAGL
jgi:hypothetical protein